MSPLENPNKKPGAQPQPAAAGGGGEFYYSNDGLVFCVSISVGKLSFDHVH